MDDTKAPAKTLAGARRAVLQRLIGFPVSVRPMPSTKVYSSSLNKVANLVACVVGYSRRLSCRGQMLVSSGEATRQWQVVRVKTVKLAHPCIVIHLQTRVRSLSSLSKFLAHDHRASGGCCFFLLGERGGLVRS